MAVSLSDFTISHCGEIIISPLLYSICQRYNFESNLQHICLHAYLCYSCIRYVKDTILEANSQHVYMHVCILE